MPSEEERRPGPARPAGIDESIPLMDCGDRGGSYLVPTDLQLINSIP